MEKINIDDLGSFIPCHHIMAQTVDTTIPAKNIDYSFETQDINMNHIFSICLNRDEFRDAKQLNYLPNDAMESIFNAVSKKQFNLELDALVKDDNFEVSYNSVKDATPEPK